jgi:hypothetical protein
MNTADFILRICLVYCEIAPQISQLRSGNSLYYSSTVVGAVRTIRPPPFTSKRRADGLLRQHWRKLPRSNRLFRGPQFPYLSTGRKSCRVYSQCDRRWCHSQEVPELWRCMGTKRRRETDGRGHSTFQNRVQGLNKSWRR